MSVTRRSRLPGKIDILAPSAYSLLDEILRDDPYAVWMGDDGFGEPTDKSGNNRHLSLVVGSNGYSTDLNYGTVLDMSSGLWQWPFRLPQTAYTLEAWIKITSSTPIQVPISDWGGGSATGAMLFITSMTLRGYHHSGYCIGGALTTGVWYYLAQTWDGSIVRLYINDSQVGTMSTSTAPGTANGPDNGAFLSGYGKATSAGLNVNGVGRGFAVFDKALSATRIYARYTHV